jgi:glycosyltransferase involved in cell wall biosynthesis
MKILMVTSFLPDRNSVSGGAVVMYGQLKTLSLSHDVTLAALCESAESTVRSIGKLKEMCSAVYTVERRNDTGVVALPRKAVLATRWLFGRHPLRTLAFSVSGMQELLDKLLSEEHFDIIQIEDSAMGTYTYRTNTPTVLTEHEVRVDCRSEKRRWHSSQIDAWKKFDAVQVFTTRDAVAITSLAGNLTANLRVNPFGIDMPALSDPEDEEAGSLLFVGGFLHPPNEVAARWLLNDIMPRLRGLQSDLMLKIVGSDPPESLWKNAGSDVKVVGRVDTVWPYLERAAVVVAPVISGGGMRVKVMQAMAMGKAVVTTPLGAEGLSAAGTDPPLIVASNPETFAGETAALLADTERRRKLGREARAFAATHYTWGAYRARLEQTYAELVPDGVA